MIEHVEHLGETIAIVVKADFASDSITFVTPNDFSLQLAYMSRPLNHVIQPHLHIPVQRSTTLTQEVLFIRKGKLRVDFYDKSKRYLESRILIAGDVILLATAGHGFEVLEPVDIVEVKQGPYDKDNDKERFVPVDKRDLRIVTS